MPSDSTPTAAETAPKGPPGIAVVVPCYRETSHIMGVLDTIGPEVSHIYVVDDACPDGTGDLVERTSKDPRVQVLRQARNTGVGGATMAGYRQALEDGWTIVVKLDGDGQMDGALIPRLVAPIAEGRADYAKGNRFHALHGVSEMPLTRIFGNLVLSLISKFSSGYWDILDPTNGFTAIHRTALGRLPLDRISQGYYFESDMLFHLGLERAVVHDVPMIARYGAEESGIRIPKVVPVFLFKHFANTCRRLWLTYFVRETNIATLQLVLGLILVAFGVIFNTIN
jgi:dolichol-phosphate mannosyltransferase